MNPGITTIKLPPPRHRRPRRPGISRWVWLILVLLSLAAGTWAGWQVGNSRSVGDAEPAPVAELQPSPLPPLPNEKVGGRLAEAREAVASGDWLAAKRHFEETLLLDPGNRDALASLPLIERRLAEARGAVRVESNPPGATVRLGSMSAQTCPALFTGVPFGEHELVLTLEGHEPLVKRVVVSSEEALVLSGLELARSSGQIEVVSEPRGADFKLVRTKEKEPEELVEVGVTPAKIERLDPGEYQVHMSVAGFPEQSQTVRVENNRNTSVSAVFARGGLNITSDPAGAEVWIADAAGEKSKPRKAGITPLSLSDLAAGKHRIELRYGDWAPIRRTVEVVVGATESLEFAWERALVSFASDPPGAEIYLGDRRLGRGQQVTPFQLEMPEADYHFRAIHPALGEIGGDLSVVGSGRPTGEASEANRVDFRFEYGSVTLESDPPGAAVVSDGKPLGRTPLTLAVVPPGEHSFQLSKEMHRSATVSGRVQPGGALQFDASLTYDPAPALSRNFKNGLGREMVWIAALRGWAGAHEVTQAEYERLGGANPSYFKAPDHPVDSVTWFEAVKFCEALSAHEQALGTLPRGYRYRLPRDDEWSELVGQQKLDGAVSSLFERQKSTAPVGSLAPNEFGLYDVRGNVWEWVGDWYSQTIVNRIQKDGATPNPDWTGTDRKVLRGGAWNRSGQFDLAVGNRMAASPSAKDRYDVGFRVVLMAD